MKVFPLIDISILHWYRQRTDGWLIFVGAVVIPVQIMYRRISTFKNKKVHQTFQSIEDLKYSDVPPLLFLPERAYVHKLGFRRQLAIIFKFIVISFKFTCNYPIFETGQDFCIFYINVQISWLLLISPNYWWKD